MQPTATDGLVLTYEPCKTGWTDGDDICRQTSVGQETMYQMEVHIGATWLIWWIDLCSGNAARCYHYYSNLLSYSSTCSKINIFDDVVQNACIEKDN